MATCGSEGLIAIGWVDGNPIHFLSSADGTAESSTQRRIGGKKQTVKAPTAIKNTTMVCSHGMQAVDWFDQLVSLFSLAKQHAFKKYYNKLAMALINIALVNAEQHYHMAGSGKQVMQDSIFEMNWQMDFCSLSGICMNHQFILRRCSPACRKKAHCHLSI